MKNICFAISYMLKMIEMQCHSANKALIIMPDTLAIYKKRVQVPSRAVGCSDGSHSECHFSIHVGKKSDSFIALCARKREWLVKRVTLK